MLQVSLPATVRWLQWGAVGECPVAGVCYGETQLTHNYSFFYGNPLIPNGLLAHSRDSIETVTMALLSLEDLGLATGQRYYGFSYFPIDVDPNIHDLTDTTSFPGDTADTTHPGDGADMYGGMSALYIVSQLPSGSGSIIPINVFVDSNGDGINDDSESGVEGIALTLYADSNGNGVFDSQNDSIVGQPVSTNTGGEASFVGVPDGIYFLELDESDPDLPAGIELPSGTNPILVLAPLADGESINFAFADTGGGATGGGTTSGGTTSGGTTSGGTTSGGTTSGGTTSGGTTSGGTTSGGTTSGGTTSGGTTGGGTTGGGTTGGGTTSGGTTGGGTTGGGTTGGGTTGGGTTSGGTTSGGTTGGGTTGGGTTGGGTTGGGTTGGGTTGGGPNDDDTLPVATDDVRTARQNIALLIDVLANDLDPAQGGLTITDVSAVQNGTASIVNQQIEFIPGLGFLGTTAFTYTIQDVNGAEDSGTVTVTVIRYSDINNDGINDFDQCGGCSSIELITGVHGAGLGSLTPELLMLLSACVFMRRLRRHKAGG